MKASDILNGNDLDPEVQEKYLNTLNKLIEIGFQQEQIENAINFVGSFEVNDLIPLLTKINDLWDHDFISNGSALCLICQNPEETHLNRYEEEKVNNSYISLFDTQCDICLNPTSDSWNLLACDQHFFCSNCVRQYLEVLITSSKVSKIRCPGDACAYLISDREIKQAVSESLFNKYLKFKRRAELIENQNVKWCPKPDCEGFVQKGNSNPCNECGSLVCFNCGQLEHPEKNCDEVDDEEFNTWAHRQEVQLCPKCQHKIQKIEGCNHMTCGFCKYNWCWLCRSKYSRIHYHPLNPIGCPGLCPGFNSRSDWPLWKIYLLRVKTLMVILTIALAFPLLLAIVPGFFVCRRFNMTYYYKPRVFLVLMDVLIFVLVLMLTPVALVIGGPILLYMIIKRQRRRNTFNID